MKDERPAKTLGLGFEAGLADEARELGVCHRKLIDPERADGDLANRALAVFLPRFFRSAAHPERSAVQSSHALVTRFGGGRQIDCELGLGLTVGRLA